MSISKCNNGSLCESVDNQRQENPPSLRLVLVVKDTVFPHVRLVDEELLLTLGRLLSSTGNGKDTVSEET